MFIVKGGCFLDGCICTFLCVLNKGFVCVCACKCARPLYLKPNMACSGFGGCMVDWGYSEGVCFW